MENTTNITKDFNIESFFESVRAIGKIAAEGNIRADKDLLDIEEFVKYCIKSFGDTCEDCMFLERVKCSSRNPEVYNHIISSDLRKINQMAETARSAFTGINVTLKMYNQPRLFSNRIDLGQ